MADVKMKKGVSLPLTGCEFGRQLEIAMNPTAILWPMIAHVALVYIVYALISRARIKAVKSGAATSSQFRENRDEPAGSLFIRNNLENQFELPMLFYPAVLALYVTDGVSIVTVILAWLFVVSRYLHAWIHVTTNRIRHRRPAFILGYFILAVLWLMLALHIAGIG